MASFTVRVGLHDAEWKYYSKLYEKIASQSFTDVIVSSKGNRVQMPPSEYNFIGNATKEQVLAAARDAAIDTGCEYAILVTESAGRIWENLDQA